MYIPTDKMTQKGCVYLRLEASRPPMTLQVTTLPAFTEDVGKAPIRTSAASITSDTCTLPLLPSSSVTWTDVGFTACTFPVRISPKQWPRPPVWFSEVMRRRFGAVWLHDNRASPRSSSQVGSTTSTANVAPTVSFSERMMSFRWLLVWITVSCAVSPSETTAKSWSMNSTTALYFESSVNYERKKIRLQQWILPYRRIAKKKAHRKIHQFTVIVFRYKAC